MRCVFGAVLAAAAAVAAGCGGGDLPQKHAPSGPAFAATLAKAQEGAARTALLRYAERRREAAVAEVSSLRGEVPAESPAPRMPNDLPPNLKKLLEAQEAVVRWTALIKDLKSPSSSSCFAIKNCTAGEVKENWATSRLVVGLVEPHAKLAANDLVFDLRWRRVVRPGAYKGVPRADWELGDVQDVSGGKEKSPEE